MRDTILFYLLINFGICFGYAGKLQADSSPPSYGLFDKIADWGTEEFPPKIGKFKAPGHVEIERKNEDWHYTIYGNGSGFERVMDEGIFLYTEYKGSWSLTARIELPDQKNINSHTKSRSDDPQSWHKKQCPLFF